MFDSRSLRRKLGNLVPGEGARRQLQNVLTVEWDTHKTVIVEVPGVNERSPDVEMEGMGLNRRDEREGYGRLDDGDDDYLDSPYSTNPNMGIEPTSSGSGSGYFDRNRTIARPQSSRSQSYNSDKRLPSVPAVDRQRQLQRQEEALNPFVSADDFAPTPTHSSQSSSFLQPQPQSQSRRPTQLSGQRSVRTMEEGWNTFGNPARTPEERGVKEPTSPSSSRGTRDSGQTTSDENPFR